MVQLHRLPKTKLWVNNRSLSTRSPFQLHQGSPSFGFRVAASASAATYTSKEDPIMKIRPLGDRVLVKRIEEEEKTKGGNHYPRHSKRKASGRSRNRRRQREIPRE